MTFDATSVVDSDPSVDSSPDGVASGWVSETPIVTPCAKRHSYKGGDVCLKCGTPKPVRQARTSSAMPSEATRTPRAERPTSASVRTLRGAVSLGWLGLGVACEHWGRPEHVARPVGRVLQFEAAVAGPRIESALRKTPAWKPIMAILNQVSPWADLAPLIGPPVLVGLMSWQPRLRPVLANVLVSLLVPVLSEAEKTASEQMEAVAALGNFTEENISRAQDLVAAILSEDEEDSHPNGAV